MTNHANGSGPGGIPLIYAHQGGWDEMLMVAVPIIVIIGLLRVARRRAQAPPHELSSEPPNGSEATGVTAPIEARTDEA
jgi:hypothetical protein